MSQSQDPPGLDLAALRTYFRDHVEGAADAPLRAELIQGGRSNLTYVIGQDDRRWVLRRPPLAHVLPTAHDMGREYRVISALGRSDVPVPRTYAHCLDDAVIGATFYVMSWVEGRRLAEAEDAARLGPEEADAACRTLVSTLAALHRVEPERVGLGDFGRPAGFVERQVRRWYTQWERSKTQSLPEVDELRDRLATALPESQATTVVHGDYRFDNLLLARDAPRVVAVLDWEMATLGDPLTDLGLLLVYWTEPGDGVRREIGVAPDVTAGPGFWSRRRVAETYAELTGFDLSDLGFYVALGCYKLAIVLEGIHDRHLHGAYGDEDFGEIWAGVPDLVRLGLAATDRGLDALSA
ncbi:MAG: phosphotransferase family protein [Streptosporangiaceae bacterium]